MPEHVQVNLEEIIVVALQERFPHLSVCNEIPCYKTLDWYKNNIEYKLWVLDGYIELMAYGPPGRSRSIGLFNYVDPEFLEKLYAAIATRS